LTKLKHIFILLAVLSCFYQTTAQDVHFSQFYNSPLTLNPANVGDFDGAWRVSGILRRQWAVITPFQTLSIGADLPFFLGKHRFGAGLYAVQDQTGHAGLASLKIMGALSYQKKISGNIFNIGFQGGFSQFGYDITDLVWADDYNHSTGYYEPGTNAEQYAGEPVKYVDINAGINWTKKFGKFVPKVGFAIFHITRPTYTVSDDVVQTPDTKLPNRFVYTFTGTYKLNEQYFLMPNVLLMTHKQARNFSYGVNFGIDLSERLEKFDAVYFGPQFRSISGFKRNSDAFILTAGVMMNKLKIGVSRDMTVSRMQSATAGQQGAWEVSLIYIAPDVKLKKRVIPCDRY
jgi:type IX secretion system PorP/SprF family membrane protein